MIAVAGERNVAVELILVIDSLEVELDLTAIEDFLEVAAYLVALGGKTGVEGSVVVAVEARQRVVQPLRDGPTCRKIRAYPIVVANLQLADTGRRIRPGLVDEVDHPADAAHTEQVRHATADKLEMIDPEVGAVVDIRCRGVQTHAADHRHAVEFEWCELILAGARQPGHEDVRCNLTAPTFSFQG